MWIASYMGGLFICSKDDLEILYHFNEDSGIGPNVYLMQNGDDYIWANTSNGLVSIDIKTLDVKRHNIYADNMLYNVVGFNYKVNRYEQAFNVLPQRLILGSETASTVSSRGVYHFPVKVGPDQLKDDHQCTSYDTGHCGWSNIPDEDFAADEDYPWCIGQFVWTGFDYLGEPSPYDTDAWPNHSSVFGIVDLAYIGAGGMRMIRLFMCCLTGIGKDVRVK